LLNINQIDTVYLACGVTDLRKSIDALMVIVKMELNLDPYEKALFVFCNRQMNKLKILQFDNGFWLHYYRLDENKFNWPMNKEEALKVDMDELKWLLKGYEVRTKSKFKSVEGKKHF